MERPIVIDAHVHFWDPAKLHYPWLDAVPALKRPFLPAQYEPFADDTVDAVVFVEANAAPTESAREVAFVDELAAREPRIAATVAFVDLLDEDEREATLEHLAQSGRAVGVRQNIQGQPMGFCLNEAFVRGVQEVGGQGLTFDLCVTATQLAEVTELVRRAPGTQFVLDHCGKPAIRDDAFEPWATDLARLAKHHGNVFCKLSGLFTEARPEQRTYEALLPYLDHVLACFGPSRLMYGSDWPVVALAGGAAAWHDLTRRFTAGWSDVDRQRFYADNAIRFYGLPIHA
jgi:L-fuconolactonase